jgi:hypothetical protein
MPTPSSGQISFQNLKDTFGTGNPVSYSQLYKGGTYVPNITPNNSVPTSNTIAINNFYSTWGKKTLSFTMSVGTVSGKGKKGSLFGFGAGFGSISSNTFLTPGGPIVIQGLYYSTGNAKWHLSLSHIGSAPADTDLSFRQVSVSGYSINGVRASRTNTSVIGTSRQWAWSVVDTAHPTSGTVTCNIQYYG